MKIKRRGWIGKDCPIELVVEVVAEGYQGDDLEVGDIVIEKLKSERGKSSEWGEDSWPPRPIEVTIEVEDLITCSVCREPYTGDMDDINICKDCERVERIKECPVCGYLHDIGPSGLCKGCELDEKKINKLPAPYMITQRDYPETIHKKINELIDQVNEMKSPAKKGRSVCPKCERPIKVTDGNFFHNGEYFHNVCRRRKE